MKSIERLYQDITKKGYEAKLVNLTDEKQGIMVSHDYYGPYPSKETFDLHHEVMRIAKKSGYQAEQRGHYVATLIF